VALRRGTFFDLPADLSLALFCFPIASSVILDANGKIEGIRDVIGDGSLLARTADSTKRHTLAKINGFDSAYSADTNSNGILLTDYSKLPLGDAERHMTWVVVSQDGVVGGYRGGGRQYWIDNPFPDYRLRTNVADYTGSGTTNNSQLHGLSLNHRNISGATSRSQMVVDGSQRLDQPVTLNTSLGTYGIKGAELAYYTMKGNTVLHYIGKRAATVDEQYKIDSACQFYTGMALPSGHPYATTPWMVDDGASPNGAATGGSYATAQAFAIVNAIGASVASSLAIATATVAALAAGSAVSASAAAAVGSLRLTANGSAFGGAVVAGDARQAVSVIGTASGSSIAQAAGSSSSGVVGTAYGSSMATAAGLLTLTGQGAAIGFGLASAAPSALVLVAGTAAGSSAATATASSGQVVTGTGAAYGASLASANASVVLSAVGAATGNSTASAASLVRATVVGTAAGSSSAQASRPTNRPLPPASNRVLITDGGSRFATIADTGARRVTV